MEGQLESPDVDKKFLSMHLRTCSKPQEPVLAHVWQRKQGVLQDLLSPYIVAEFSGRHMVIQLKTILPSLLCA